MTQSQTDQQAQTIDKRQFAGTIAGLQLILLLAALDQTIITTAMPKIISELGGFSRYAWATTSYLLTSTIAVPVFGRLSDTYGRKPLLLLGVVIFIIASVLCGNAGLIMTDSGMLQLILARALQGIGGGIMLGLVFSVIADILAPADRGRYQGHFAAVFALASIVGPALGGWIADQYTWRWLFFVNVPVGLIAIAVFQRSFPAKRINSTGAKTDLAGIAIFSTMLVTLLFALGSIADYGLTGAPVLIALALAVVMAGAFVAIESKAAQPLMPLPLFARPIIAISSISLFVTGIGMFGSVLLIPLFLQVALSVTAAASGALLTPLILTVALASIVGGLCISRTRQYKSLILFSLLLMTIGVFQLSRINESTSLTLIIGYMLVVGSGMGLLLPVYPIVIQNAVPQDQVGTVTGFSQFFRSIGGTIGVALFGSVMLGAYRKNLAHVVSPSLQQVLDNPLHGAKLKAQLISMVSAQTDVTPILNQVKHALVLAIDHVFLLYTGALVVVLIMSLWLEDRTLRAASESGVHLETV